MKKNVDSVLPRRVAQSRRCSVLGASESRVRLRADDPPSASVGCVKPSRAFGIILGQDDSSDDARVWRNGYTHDIRDLVGASAYDEYSSWEVHEMNKQGQILATALKPINPSNPANKSLRVLILLPVEIDSDRATIQPKYRGSPSNPYLCNNIDHIAAGEKIEGALTIYHKAVRDEDGETEDFDVILKVAPIGNVTWTKTAGPDSGELVDANSPTAIFRNPKKGGLYEFELSVGDQPASEKLQLWLPVAGPDISSYWESEIAYFKNTWGPAYRSKLNDRTVLLALNPPARWMLKRELAAFDMLRIGNSLDWNGEIRGDETPCGGPISTPGNRLTLHGFVISWSKRNNMMYALIGEKWDCQSEP